jgi:hypothetical protein
MGKRGGCRGSAAFGLADAIFSMFARFEQSLWPQLCSQQESADAGPPKALHSQG